MTQDAEPTVEELQQAVEVLTGLMIKVGKALYNNEPPPMTAVEWWEMQRKIDALNGDEWDT